MENTGAEKEDTDQSKEAAAAQAALPILQTEIERFVAYLDQAPRECSSMVRGWLREPEAVQIFALTAIVEELPNEKLTALVTMFSEEERGKLRATVQANLKSTEMTQAKDYIGSQVRDEILKGEKIEDTELQQMLLSLSPKKAAQLLVEYPDYIAELFSKLTPKFLGLILEQLNEKSKAIVLNHALTQKNLTDVGAFKSVLSQYVELELFSPSLEKIKMILPDASINTEETLYHAIAVHGNAHSVKACALRHFPYSLVTRLPEDILKEALLQYDSVKRIEYLEILNEQDKEHLIGAFAPAGSKARDIYELDYERVFANDEAPERIKSQSETIAKNFISHLRDYIRKNQQFRGAVEGVISKWTEEVVARKKNVELKMVS